MDKFVLTDTGGSSTVHVVSSKLTLSQANNTSLGRDGGNDATADISLNLHKLTNVADPANDKDAANKDYVDPSVANSGSNKSVKKWRYYGWRPSSQLYSTTIFNGSKTRL